jgi:hypothetical protein
MKKMKYFMIAALTLGLALTACDKGGGNNTTPSVDNRGRVAGAYPVKVTDIAAGNIYTDLVIAKEGAADLRVWGTMNVYQVGRVSVDLVLSGLKGFNNTDDGEAVTGYMFKIAPQSLDITGTATEFQGSAAQVGGYDGMLYKNDQGEFIVFGITTPDGKVTANFETGVQVDNRAALAGVYPVKLTTSITLLGDIYADLNLAVEGDKGFKAFGTADVAGIQTAVEVFLTELTEFDTDEEGNPVTGYYFNAVPGQVFEHILVGRKILIGMDLFDGYTGKVYKGESGSYIYIEVCSDDPIEDRLTLSLESVQPE